MLRRNIYESQQFCATLQQMFFAREIEVIEKPLGIPYFRDDPGSHNFVDLRENSAAIDDLPELKKRKQLYDFVKALNEPTSQYQTFGCETWEEPWTHPETPGLVTCVGSYVDITFANLILCRNQWLLRSLIKQFQKYGQECIKHTCSLVIFNLRRTVSGVGGQWWTLEFWNWEEQPRSGTVLGRWLAVFPDLPVSSSRNGKYFEKLDHHGVASSPRHPNGQSSGMIGDK